jgi:hypothetical protein
MPWARRSRCSRLGTRSGPPLAHGERARRRVWYPRLNIPPTPSYVRFLYYLLSFVPHSSNYPLLLCNTYSRALAVPSSFLRLPVFRHSMIYVVVVIKSTCCRHLHEYHYDSLPKLHSEHTERCYESELSLFVRFPPPALITPIRLCIRIVCS